ncbi:MAG: DUF2520 domain-containing protein [Thermoguttaceae bacterium]|jgi:hypothetical protein
MENRRRKNQLKIYLSDEEKEIFEKKMKMAECRTMAHFLRKCVLEKEIYIVDLEPFRELQGLLANATNNINQIARATNITGIIYRDDIDFIKKEIEKIARKNLQIYFLLLKRTKEISSY